MLVQQCFSTALFRGKTVFVTGGGSGINLGVAKNFAALGANVAICGRTQARLDAAAEELRTLGASVCAVAADVRDYAALASAFARRHPHWDESEQKGDEQRGGAEYQTPDALVLPDGIAAQASRLILICATHAISP